LRAAVQWPNRFQNRLIDSVVRPAESHIPIRSYQEVEKAQSSQAPEHAAELPDMLRGNSDPGRVL
jgi:hypothetical protein